MEPGETCCSFVDKVKEQAQRLEKMGERVSDTNLLTRLNQVHPLLASNLYIQGCEDLKVVEDVIRGYDNTPMPKQTQSEGGQGERGCQNSGGKWCSEALPTMSQERHLANDCYANQGRKSHNRGIGKPTHNVVKRYYICKSSNHLQAECPKNKTGNNDRRSFTKSKGSADERKSNSERSWKWKPTQQRKRKHSWNEGSDNSSVDRSNMMSSAHIKPQETVIIEGDDQSDD
jgi:hypothetical protein